MFFLGNKGKDGNFALVRNVFTKCSSLYGGAIYISDQNILLNNNTFNSNNATVGGAIYFECPTVTNCIWDLQSLQLFFQKLIFFFRKFIYK